MSKIFQRKVGPDFPNLIKHHWEVTSVQDFTRRLLYTCKIIFIKKIME